MASVQDLHQPLGDELETDALLADLTEQRKRMQLGDASAREEMVVLARKLIASLETPLEATQWMFWAEPAKTFASRMALDLKIFDTLVEDGGRPKSLEELAKPTNASTQLIHRIARMLSKVYLIRETGEGEYAPNNLSHILTVSKYYAGIMFCYDCIGPSFAKMPEYFEKNGFDNPEDYISGPFPFAQKLPVFPWLEAHPKVFEAFHEYVDAQREYHPDWTDTSFYPISERLLEGIEEGGDAATFVDVAGGTGQVLAKLDSVFKWPGRLVLQELDAAIQRARATGLKERVETMEYDFFTPQPIKGARVYHMRYIMHDHSDKTALEIMSHIKEAMRPGYSKMIINDCVLADKGASWQHASLDLFMMAVTSSQERTEKQWKALIEKAGLELTGIWSKGAGNTSIIEVMKRE